jgi:hypothetical protein
VQFDLRKPIYYFKEEECCNFLILSSDTAYVYTLKKNKEYTSKLELLVDTQTLKNMKKFEIIENFEFPKKEEKIEEQKEIPTFEEQHIEEKIVEKPKYNINDQNKEENHNKPNREENVNINKKNKQLTIEKYEIDHVNKKTNKNGYKRYDDTMANLSADELDKQFEDLLNDLNDINLD